MQEEHKKEERQGESIIRSKDFEKEFLELRKIAERAKEIYKEELKWKEKNLEE